jgi:hypothetical protein
MSRYFFNEGSLDLPEIGAVDATIHVVDLDGDVRLIVDRKPLREGATPRALATARTELEGRELPSLTVVDEREREASFEVAAYFKRGPDLVFQLRRHFMRAPHAFAVTMRGPMAAREGMTARMDALFATLRFRHDDTPGAR